MAVLSCFIVFSPNEATDQLYFPTSLVQGIVCSLNAKVSILATANPINSRYDATKTIMENINLPATLTSRFDLVYLMLDKQDPVADQRLARHLVGMFSQSGQQTERSPPLDRELFRAYVSFARRRCRPRLSPESQLELAEKYLSLRSGQVGQGCYMLEAWSSSWSLGYLLQRFQRSFAASFLLCGRLYAARVCGRL